MQYLDRHYRCPSTVYVRIIIVKPQGFPLRVVGESHDPAKTYKQSKSKQTTTCPNSIQAQFKVENQSVLFMYSIHYSQTRPEPSEGLDLASRPRFTTDDAMYLQTQNLIGFKPVGHWPWELLNCPRA